jgi:sulfopropanediol 3-dehydrogenase
MKVIKAGGHRLFEHDVETAATVSAMLLDLEKNGMDAVRKYSHKFDSWNPESFQLDSAEIERAINEVPEVAIEDTDYCQQNVRVFAEAQLKTLLPLEVNIRPGVTLGHRHIPVNSVGSYIPGGRYPMFGSAQMSIIPAKVAGVKHVTACTPPVRGKGYFPATINAIQKAGADSIYILGGVPALAPWRLAWMEFRLQICFVAQGIASWLKQSDSFSAGVESTYSRGQPRYLLLPTTQRIRS